MEVLDFWNWLFDWHVAAGIADAAAGSDSRAGHGNVVSCLLPSLFRPRHFKLAKIQTRQTSLWQRAVYGDD